MRWKPNVTVAAIVEKAGRFLIVEEEKAGRKLFNQPAGHLKKNETLLGAVKREVLEETAWEFEPESLIGTYLHSSTGSEMTYLRFCFAGHCCKHYPKQTLDKGIIQTHWLTKAELESKKANLRSPVVLQCIEDFIAGQCYTLNVLKHYLSPSPPD